MKSCPKCNRTYPDENQKFCTFDGGLLVTPQTFDPNVTVRATSIEDATARVNSASEQPTNRDLPDPEATIAAASSYAPTTAFPRGTGPAAMPTATQVGAPVPTATQQLPPLTTAPPKKKSKWPWIIAAVVLLLFLGGAGLAGVFFIVIKPRLSTMTKPPRPVETSPPAVAGNINQPEATPTERPSPSPAATESFVPPPGTVQYVNSKDKIEGKLAEHYLDFSFYYPKSWKSDPRAGQEGSSNFVKFERNLPPDFTQESFAVGWYTSTGTFASDLPTYPQLVELLSANLSKSFPGYRKVSEGHTKINSLDGYEFRFVSLSKGTEKGDIQLWGRVVFLPRGVDHQSNGATLIMLATSLAPELSGVDDVGVKGEMPVVLESFRFDAK
ncbi:MAG: hypothetical protein ABR555_05050 [Pyrinomonadaceae bacterium]